jgi:hypothetical protein
LKYPKYGPKKPYINQNTKKMQTVTFDGLKIEKASDESFYITLGDLVVYVDISTGENHVSAWVESKMLLSAVNVM